MKKTYISSLMVAMMAGSTAAWAQDADAFSAFDVEALSEAATPEVMMTDVPSEAVATESMSLQAIIDRGIELYQKEEYEAAEAAFKVVQAKDEYNRIAMNYLNAIAVRVRFLEGQRRDVIRQQKMTEIDKKWVPDDKGVIVALDEPEEEVVTEEDLAKERMLEKLKNTEISTMNFQGTSIQSAAMYLAEETRRNDSDGINMILLGLNGSDSMGSGAVGNNITISIRKMSLFETLNAITEMASLRYEVAPNVVYIMPQDYVRQVDMVEEMISVSKSVGEKLAELAAPSQGDIDEVGSLFGPATTSVEVSGPVSLNEYIKSLGIATPTRSVATYFSDSKQVSVRNTAENIQKIKDKLSAIQQDLFFEASQQVKIEAKFVEFSEGAFDEYGVDWNVFGTGSVGGFQLDSAGDGGFGKAVAKQYVSSITTDEGTILQSGLTRLVPEGQNVFGYGHRTGNTAFEGVTSGILASMGSSGIIPSMIFDRGDLAAKLSLLEQEGTADVLSCPSVTTMSGEEAIMRVVEIHRYPQDYDVETGQRTAPIVKPQDWEDFDLGVVLRVMPDINDNGTITMKLDPEIRKFKGFEDYAVAVNSYVLDNSVPGGGGSETYGEGNQLFARMPYFEIRSVSTRVTVADGHTVVMGGLIDERSETFRDQVPLLGDIPYLGKLFRHEGTRTEKKNLMLYVTPTQVDVRGMSIEESNMARAAASL